MLNYEVFSIARIKKAFILFKNLFLLINRGGPSATEKKKSFSESLRRKNLIIYSACIHNGRRKAMARAVSEAFLLFYYD